MVGRCEVLAIGAHPDDVELGCGATLARLAAAGKIVGILDLTNGELGTRGDASTRRQEAELAARALGVARRSCLGLADGHLSSANEEQLAALVKTLREAAPRALLAPHNADPHPDHRAAAELVSRAHFLAGVARWQGELGGPERAHLVLAYPGPRQLFEPALVIDVSASYPVKRAALAAHASQFAVVGGAPTHLASGYFLAAIEGRDRAAGNLIGYELGEGYAMPGPVAAGEIAWLLSPATEPGLRPER
ncbi:MAG: bacillithiol biosynthesis deacetylase BshB1 [Acidobacteriota bacterium]